MGLLMTTTRQMNLQLPIRSGWVCLPKKTVELQMNAYLQNVRNFIRHHLHRRFVVTPFKVFPVY